MAFVTPFAPATSEQVPTLNEASASIVPRVLVGWAFRETTGSASAVIRIRDGSTVAGRLLVSVPFSSGQGSGEWYGDNGLDLFNSALYLEVVSGSVEGAIYWS